MPVARTDTITLGFTRVPVKVTDCESAFDAVKLARGLLVNGFGMKVDCSATASDNVATGAEARLTLPVNPATPT